MTVIPHKMDCDPIARYMIDHFAYGRPAESAFLYPISCGTTDDNGNVIDEYAAPDGLTWTHNMYCSKKKASRIHALYTCMYKDHTILLLFTMELADFNILNEAINTILQVYFKEFSTLRIGECKKYTDRYCNKINVTRFS